MEQVLVAAATIVALVLALWLALRLIYREPSMRDDTIRFVLVVAMYVLLSMASLALCVVLGGPVGFLLWIVALAIVLMALFQYRHAQRRALLDLLSVCAEHQIPLPPAIFAFAGEEGGRSGSRTARLANELERGSDLAVAIQRDRRVLPHGSAMAAALGQQTGDLAGALGELDANLRSSESIVQAIFAQLLYFTCLLLFIPGIITFMMIKIAPAFIRILSDFEMTLPPITEYVFDVVYSPVVVPLLMCFIGAGVLATIYFGLYYVGAVRFALPGTGWLFRRLESVRVLGGLALAVDHQRPFADTMRVMVDAGPANDTTQRLMQATLDIDRGTDWWAALERRKLVGPAEAAVLAAASRAGNLSWALREMADFGYRRTLHQIEVWLQVLFPLAILILGSFLLIYVVAFFLPLVQMIKSLA